MQAMLVENTFSIEAEVESHPAWHGCLAGLEAEDLLKGHSPFVFLLRAGEKQSHYYVSFVLPDLTIKHQPVWVYDTPQGWCYRNLILDGPFMHTRFEDVIHAIMHCRSDEYHPLRRTYRLS